MLDDIPESEWPYIKALSRMGHSETINERKEDGKFGDVRPAVGGLQLGEESRGF